MLCVKHALAVPAPVAQADELKKQMPPEQTQWLADVDAMQAAFRHVRHGCSAHWHTHLNGPTPAAKSFYWHACLQGLLSHAASVCCVF